MIPLRAKPVGRYKFNWKKKSAYPRIWCQRICLSASGQLWPQFFFDFLAGNNYPDLPYLQGGMKFATQISPLLNYYNPGAANLFHKEDKICLKSGKKVGSGKTTVMFKIYFLRSFIVGMIYGVLWLFFEGIFSGCFW